MNFFWPQQLNQVPNGFTRLGRVLHWISTGLAITALVAGTTLTIGYAIQNQYGSVAVNAAMGTLTTFVFVIVLYFPGRALRYIFAAE